MREAIAATILSTLLLPAGSFVDLTGSARSDQVTVAAYAGRDRPILPAVRVRRYQMSGAVRPLLFWIGRDDIGVARITWRKGDDGAVGYELLVGTDPGKAPRGLNRWGYVAEDTRADSSWLLALMTGADEGSYDEAASNTGRPAGGGDFRAIRARLVEGTSSWQTARVATAAPLTVHDVDATLDPVGREVDAATMRDRSVPGGVRGGFLIAVADLLDGVTRYGDARGGASRRVQYVFGQGIYELSIRGVEAGRADIAGRPVPVVRTAFEIRTLATDARTRFELTSGRDGDLAGVPVAIEWQPRWWLRVSLRLKE